MHTYTIFMSPKVLGVRTNVPGSTMVRVMWEVLDLPFVGNKKTEQMASVLLVTNLTDFGKIRFNLTIGCLPEELQSSVALIYGALLLSDGTKKNVQMTCKWAKFHSKFANRKHDVFIPARFEFALWVTSSEVSIMLIFHMVYAEKWLNTVKQRERNKHRNPAQHLWAWVLEPGSIKWEEVEAGPWGKVNLVQLFIFPHEKAALLLVLSTFLL